MRKLLARSPLAAVAIALASCAGDCGTDPAPEPAEYAGLWAGPAVETGVLELTIAPPAERERPEPGGPLGQASLELGAGQLQGTLTLSTVAGPITLTGTLDLEAGRITFAGTATTALGAFTCEGTVTPEAIRGTCTGADGVERRFELRGTAAGAPTFYCGELAGDVAGTWNLLADPGGSVAAVFWSNELAGAATGTRTGDALALTLVAPARGTAAGTFAGDEVSGSWTATGFGQGTFAGSTAACPVAGEPPVDAGVDAPPPIDGGGGPPLPPPTVVYACTAPCRFTCNYPVLTDTHVYCGGGSGFPLVTKTPLAGGAPTTLASADVTLSAIHLTRSSTQLAYVLHSNQIGATDGIFTLPLASNGGTPPTAILPASATAPTGLCANDAHVYMPTDRLVKRMAWDGSGLTNLFPYVGTNPFAARCVLDASAVYFLYGTAAPLSLARDGLAGGTPVRDYTRNGQPIQTTSGNLVQNSTHLFVRDPDGVTLYGVPKGGGEAHVVATSPSNDPSMRLAADDTHLYWSTTAGLYRAPVEGGAVETIRTGFVGLAAVDARHVAGWVSDGASGAILYLWTKP